MAVGPLKSKITVDAIAATATARGEPKFLPIDVADAIAKKNPIYESEEIPASIFGSSPQRPEDKVDTVAINHLIIAPKSLSDTAVAAFARQLFTNRQQLARELPTASQIEKPDTDKDAALPAHAGAAAYIDGNERTFLEKYTDYIWFVVLIALGPGIGRRLAEALLEQGRARAVRCPSRSFARADFQGAQGRNAGRTGAKCKARPTACCARRWIAMTTAPSRKATCR